MYVYKGMDLNGIEMEWNVMFVQSYAYAYLCYVKVCQHSWSITVYDD